MRAAICSDIHGNLAALEAVLADADAAGAEEFWVVGDLVAHGPRPGQTVRRLHDLAATRPVRIVRGNTDRYTTTGQLSPYLLGLDPVAHPDKDSQVRDARAAFAWTRQAVEDAGCLTWLAGLPAEIRLSLPDGTGVLLVHAAPGTDDGPGIFAEQSDEELRAAGVAAAGAQGVGLVVVGHTHVPMDRTVDRVRVVNLGSVSVPVTPDPRAMWTLLTADQDGWTLDHRRTDYDLDQVIADLHAVGHPSAGWLASKMGRAHALHRDGVDMVSLRHHSDVVLTTSRSGDAALAVTDLVRTYRKREGWFRSRETVEAVRGITFAVRRGGIFGILGPNGAGKTTTIKMLSTLLIPTAGVAEVDGFDVTKEEVEVRRRLGVLFGGDKGLYNQLSARENLRYFGHLYGMTGDLITERSDELLAKVGLGDRANERVESYSRGMKQRLHIAKTLIHRPPVVILDEPTIGLDPGAALEVRALISELAPEHTVMLSTHDMHEADVLCETVAIIDHGLIVAEGTPAELKAAAPVDRQVLVSLSDGPRCGVGELTTRLSGLPAVLAADVEPSAEGYALLLRCTDSSVALDSALAVLRADGSEVRSIDVREPSLEDAFLGATGRTFDPGEAEEDAA